MNERYEEILNQVLNIFYDLPELMLNEVKEKVSFIESESFLTEMLQELDDLKEEDSIHNRTKIVDDYYVTEVTLQKILKEKSFHTTYHYDGYKEGFRSSFLETLRVKRVELDEYLDSVAFKNTLKKNEPIKNAGCFHEIDEESFIFELEKYYSNQLNENIEVLLSQDDSTSAHIFSGSHCRHVITDVELMDTVNEIYNIKTSLIHYHTENKTIYFLEYTNTQGEHEYVIPN